jgi:hypothetical protein
MPTNIIPQYLRSTNMFPMQQAPPTQQTSIPLVKPKSVARAILKTIKKESDATISAKQAMGKKLHKILIKAKGDVDGCYEGKNVWDDVMRMLIPQIIDINVVE